MSRILIIEDETILREEVIEWLTLEDYEAFGAANGLEGINEAIRLLPDLIICDITMPLLDGHGVLLELRSNLSTVAIPFIFVTARASHEDIRAGMNLGADDYITKPFTRLELLGAVEARLEKQNIREQRQQQEIEQWQQAFEEERELRQMKAKLVAMFSHDFRNPLSSIISSISLVRDYADHIDEERRTKHLNRVDASARRLLQMLDDMLIVFQMESGNLKFTPQELDAAKLLSEIVQEFQPICGETCQLICDSDVEEVVNMDLRLFRQIAANLISNAIKYSATNCEIFIQLKHVDGELVLTVQDQGIGIPETEQKQLFRAFKRASNVGNRAGTGLGLAIVKEAVNLHGGNIYLESEVNSGTTVKVTIPA